jgi:cytochrome c oxidase cbb3-type subunit 3
MAISDRDPHSGYLTTGHEWSGIKELNTPVPRAVFAFLAIAVLFSLGYWVLMPAWPIGSTYTKGLLGIDQRAIVAESLKAAALDRATWTSRIEQADFATIQGDPALMARVRQTGRTLFGDNCAACHGYDAAGNTEVGAPNLTATAWLWGGTPDAIAQTIRVGINSAHPDTRVSQMPAFGRDQMIPRDAVENVVAYVYGLSHPTAPGAAKPQIEAGKAVFAANCVSCHGEAATGNVEVGAPNLTDRFWLHGGDLPSIYATVWGGRQGHMPTWEARLPAVDRKILALYVLDLKARDR